MTSTRPDLSAAVSLLSQYMSKPGKHHWSGVKRVLRYLKGTVNHGICYQKGNCEVLLSGYSDESWGDCLDTRRSTSGYVFSLGGNLISWRTKKQSSVAKSSTEAEIVALSQAIQECLWLRHLLSNLSFTQTNATVIYEDNQGALDLAKNSKYSERSKHIEIHNLFCRERVTAGDIVLKYCRTSDMLADIMTKAVPYPCLHKMGLKLGITDTLS